MGHPDMVEYKTDVGERWPVGAIVSRHRPVHILMGGQKGGEGRGTAVGDKGRGGVTAAAEASQGSGGEGRKEQAAEEQAAAEKAAAERMPAEKAEKAVAERAAAERAGVVQAAAAANPLVKAPRSLWVVRMGAYLSLLGPSRSRIDGHVGV